MTPSPPPSYRFVPPCPSPSLKSDIVVVPQRTRTAPQRTSSVENSVDMPDSSPSNPQPHGFSQRLVRCPPSPRSFLPSLSLSSLFPLPAAHGGSMSLRSSMLVME
mmetsp:Transcript_14605/g.24919  ORF Transcript_14605/g.24919 Transcript_14605/m.24919 type:complete len:105 (-) Transcript_14605:236-550(-)